MNKLKFKLIKQKKLKKKYNLVLANTKNTTKYKTSIFFGRYNPILKLYLFKYPFIISLCKLGSKFSKQYSLISSFYLKHMLKQNLK